MLYQFQSLICLFFTKGVWGTSEESHVVNSVDWIEEERLLTAGDDTGIVSLFKYPCSNQEVWLVNQV